jgi:DNA-nicking Smr family endonuclease
MKQLSDSDLAKMVGGEFAPADNNTVRQVRSELKLSKRIPKQLPPAPENQIIDLHGKTENESWDEINKLIFSGSKTAVVITGASGILKPKFQQWVRDSIISKYITECTPINNGSYKIKIKSNKNA